MRARLSRSDPSGSEQLAVVEFGLVTEDVRIDVGGHGEAPLSDERADPRPRHSSQVEQRDPPVTEVVRREVRDRSSPARLRDRRPHGAFEGLPHPSCVVVELNDEGLRRAFHREEEDVDRALLRAHEVRDDETGARRA